MGMFSKLVAFLDKATGVPAWVIHAENIRKVRQDCPALAKAIVENEILWPLAAYTLEEMLPQIAGMIVRDESVLTKQLVHEVIAAVEGPVEGPLQVLYDFVGKDTSTAELVEVEEEAVHTPVDTSTAELVEVEEEAVHTPVDTSTAEVVEVEEVATTSEDTPTAATSTEEVHIPVLDPHVRAQTIREMTKVISRGRKATPTLKVLNTMSGGDRATILKALHIMEARGNSLAKAILEDPSL